MMNSSQTADEIYQQKISTQQQQQNVSTKYMNKMGYKKKDIHKIVPKRGKGKATNACREDADVKGISRQNKTKKPVLSINFRLQQETPQCVSETWHVQLNRAFATTSCEPLKVTAEGKLYHMILSIGLELDTTCQREFHHKRNLPQSGAYGTSSSLNT